MNFALFETIAISPLLGLMIALIVFKFFHWRRRRKMTEYERAIEDADKRHSGDW